MPSQRKGGPVFAGGWEGRALAGALWPGIRRGGGPLDAVLARMARWGVRGGD